MNLNASGQYPELEFEFLNEEQPQQFAIHCSWYPYLETSNNITGIQVATDPQLKNYLKYQRRNRLPVWIALGVGGSASIPNALYLVSLSDIKKGFLSDTEMETFKVRKLNQRFSYNPNTKRVINE